ncbi:YesL family protein [Xylanimonas sp. McL0601]|uniref:YesL family protein n=1 Tax=Xylanimonas sp. McL0601 TaxID=3414739 RepID=UPI003CF20D51
MINLFWLASLALVVTAGAGTVVAYEVCRRYVLGKDAGLWAVATKAWRQSWRQATLIGLLAVPVAAAGILSLSYLPTLGLAEVVVPLVVAGLFLVLLVFWCLPLAARFTNPTWRQVRNGFTLGLTTPSLTFLLGIALVVGGVAVWNFMPAVFVAPGLILLWWCYLLERFFVARGYVQPEPEEAEV